MAKLFYKVGDACKTGQKVAIILGQGDSFAVFTTEDNHLRWECTDAEDNEINPPPEVARAIAHFDHLMAEIPRSIAPARQKTAYHQLGKALFAASINRTEWRKAFAEIEQHIKSKATERARAVYVIACAATAIAGAIVSMVPFIWCPDVYIHLAALGTIGGCIGSLLSVLQRSGKIPVDPFGSNFYLILQGGARGLLGALFGLFLVFASKADLVVGIAGQKNMALFVFAIVAGFSERLVPEILRQLEKEGSADD